jgi:ASC-1-like (ASCH) protein
MHIHQMHLHVGPFARIASCQKTIEYRLNDEKRQRIAVGDRVKFTNRSDASHALTVEVVSLHHAGSFTELLDDSAKLRELLEYYSESDQEKFGVVGIEFILVT